MTVWFRRFRSRRGTWGRSHILEYLDLPPFSSMHTDLMAACGVRVALTSVQAHWESDEIPDDACARCVPPQRT